MPILLTNWPPYFHDSFFNLSKFVIIDTNRNLFIALGSRIKNGKFWLSHNDYLGKGFRGF